MMDPGGHCRLRALEGLRAEDLAPFVAGSNEAGSPLWGASSCTAVVLCCHDWRSYLCD